MAWANSKVFRQWLADSVTRTTAYNLSTDGFKAALFNNTTTPDQNVANTALAYNTGVWVTGNEVSQAGQWAAGGVALASVSVNTATAGVVFFTASNTASGSAATLTNAYGALVYDTTVTVATANPGVCFNYFGGANSVTNGTFTVQWNSNGIWRATL